MSKSVKIRSKHIQTYIIHNYLFIEDIFNVLTLNEKNMFLDCPIFSGEELVFKKLCDEIYHCCSF